jgi:hypothetical protein
LLQEEHKERTVRQKKNHEEKMILLEKEQEKFWSLMNQLNEATTIEVSPFLILSLFFTQTNLLHSLSMKHHQI